MIMQVIQMLQGKFIQLFKKILQKYCYFKLSNKNADFCRIWMMLMWLNDEAPECKNPHPITWL